MRRLLFVVALVAAPAALAQDAGRYEVAPAPEGLIRLDTRTGATSHCAELDGVWRCEPVIEGTAALAAKLDALATEIEEMSSALATTTARLDALASRLEGTSQAPASVAPEEGRGFLATVVDRLFAMIRALKHGSDAA
jgi:hypothetical protein